MSKEEVDDLFGELEPKLSGMQYRAKDTKEFYAVARDILNFYQPLQRAVIDIVATRHPDKQEDTKKLLMQANAFINEATTGSRRLKMHEFIAMHDVVMKDIDKDVVSDYLYLMSTAVMFRYVMAKREQRKDQLKPEELGHSFQALYAMSVCPDELATAIQKHMLAYKHVPAVTFINNPPAVPDQEGGSGAGQD